MTADIHRLTVHDGRALPQAQDAERALLGAVLLDPGVLSQVPWLDPEHFYREAHARTYRTLLELDARGDQIDLVTLAAEVERAPERFGGMAYVSALADNVPSSENAAYYARLVYDAARRRDVVTRCRRAADLATDGDLAEALALLDSGQADAAATGLRHIADVADDVWREYQRREQDRRDHRDPGVPLGLRTLSHMLLVERGEQLVVAGRPGMGKTALALSMARGACRAGVGVAVFSLEMTDTALGRRLAAQEGRLAGDAIRRAQLSGEGVEYFHNALHQVAGWPLWIDETPGQTIEQIRRKARHLKAARPELGMVVVDHVGLCGSSNARWGRVESVGHVTRTGKEAAKELDVLWVALSQLNRKVEERADKRPMLADLRDTGDVEQDADAVLFVYRDEYYNKENSLKQGVAELIVAKQREGECGAVEVAFESISTAFTDIARGF